ncbi:hypothetical protein [Streptosporangium sp. NPDC006007]|uniref:hypothetical protein n=1 Tax=Streptosporangium sp. NPDC006007 TaxID=3154575 RepID=UPI0033B9EA5D
MAPLRGAEPRFDTVGNTDRHLLGVREPTSPHEDPRNAVGDHRGQQRIVGGARRRLRSVETEQGEVFHAVAGKYVCAELVSFGRQGVRLSGGAVGMLVGRDTHLGEQSREGLAEVAKSAR